MDDMENRLIKYLNEFDRGAYEQRRTTYFSNVTEENNYF